MSASLVGSEMCIRDSLWRAGGANRGDPGAEAPQVERGGVLGCGSPSERARDHRKPQEAHFAQMLVHK
eukprot:1385836-Alexandrium_andersonii.AAC.1